MQRTSAHLHIEIATDFVLYFVFKTLLLILCSRDQYTALHYAASLGHTAVCEQLIANKADVNAKAKCAFKY
jgi:ankyrin repeat protein